MIEREYERQSPLLMFAGITPMEIKEQLNGRAEKGPLEGE